MHPPNVVGMSQFILFSLLSHCELPLARVKLGILFSHIILTIVFLVIYSKHENIPRNCSPLWTSITWTLTNMTLKMVAIMRMPKTIMRIVRRPVSRILTRPIAKEKRPYRNAFGWMLPFIFNQRLMILVLPHCTPRSYTLPFQVKPLDGIMWHHLQNMNRPRNNITRRTRREITMMETMLETRAITMPGWGPWGGLWGKLRWRSWGRSRGRCQGRRKQSRCRT